MVFTAIKTEKTLMSFEEKRKKSPDNVDYSDFYRDLATSVTPSFSSRRAPSRAITFGRVRTAPELPRLPDHRSRDLMTRGSAPQGWSLASGNDEYILRLTQSRDSSRPGTMSTSMTGVVGQQGGARGVGSESVSSLAHIHEVAGEQMRSSKHFDTVLFEQRRNDRRQVMDGFLHEILNESPKR